MVRGKGRVDAAEEAAAELRADAVSEKSGERRRK